jgi:hypothetical protein
LIDTQTPQSPGWWLARLEHKLRARRLGYGWSATLRHRRYLRPGLDLLDDYLRGDPPLPDVAEGWRDLYVGLLRESRMNYAELCVSSAAERMTPLGFTTAVDSDEGGDDLAARISTANQLPLRFGDAYRWMLAFGCSYLMAGPPRRSGGMPVITGEDPRDCITADDPGTGEAFAGLKVYRDEWTGDELASVMLPGNLWVARRAAGVGFGTSEGWQWDETLSGAYPRGFEDVVPVVSLVNRDGRGEYEPHLAVLDRINSEIFRRVTVALVQAFRQRAVIGLPETSDGKAPLPNESNVIDYSDTFTADPMSIWQLPPNAQMWESAAVDLNGIRAAVKDDVMQFAAVTRTPLYAVMPDAANASAEGATVQREGLIYRVLDRQMRVEAPQARAMSMAFRYLAENDRADVLAIRTIWAPVQRYSLGEIGSAVSQLKDVLPEEVLWRDYLQIRPEEIPRIHAARSAQLQRDMERAVVARELADAERAVLAPRPANDEPAPAAPPTPETEPAA